MRQKRPLQRLDPEAYLRDVLARIADHPGRRVIAVVFDKRETVTLQRLLKTQAMALLLALAATPSTACIISKQQDFTVVRDAQVIIRARITRYEKQPTSHSAIFGFKVVETRHGPHRAMTEWTARWRNSTFGEPDKWDGPIDVIVGMKAVIDDDGVARIEVVQQSCGPASILADTPGNLHQIAVALR